MEPVKRPLINQLRRQPGIDWPVFVDYFRSTAKNLGYSRPRDILLEDSPNKDNTITAMTSAALGAMQQWFNTSATDGFIDLGPPGLLGLPALLDDGLQKNRFTLLVTSLPKSLGPGRRLHLPAK